MAEVKTLTSVSASTLPSTMADYLSNTEVMEILRQLRMAASSSQIAEQVDKLIGILRADMPKPGAPPHDQGMLLDDEWEANLSTKKAEELKMWGELFDSIIPDADLQLSTLVLTSSATLSEQGQTLAKKLSCDDLMFANLVTVIYCSGHPSFRNIAPDLIVGAAYDYAPAYSRDSWDHKYAELSVWMHAQTQAPKTSIDASEPLLLPHPRQQYALPLYWWSQQKKLSKLQ